MNKPAFVPDVDAAEAARLTDAGGMTAWAGSGLPVIRADGGPGEVT